MALNQAQALAMLSQVTQLENQLKMSTMPQAQSGMDASNLLKMISQLRSQGNPTPKKKSSDSNNQAQMLIQLDPAKFPKARIGKEDKKSMDVTKVKENWVRKGFKVPENMHGTIKAIIP